MRAAFRFIPTLFADHFVRSDDWLITDHCLYSSSFFGLPCWAL